MKLVIVESPTKSKTIAHYLGDDFVVEASVGHIRDLAISGKGGFGVDVDNDFKPTYVIDKDKKEVVSKLKKLLKNADDVYLATDPDREGEAIAWHLLDVLKLPLESTKRLEFHEITRESIKNAIDNPRLIDMNLVHSQEARRIIDRILGFKLSTLLNQKIKSKSAGRVQSVTLKLICDHEEEINNFKEEEYWTIEPYIKRGDNEILLDFIALNNEKIEISNEEEADKIISLINEKVIVSKVEKKERKTSSKEPFRTSTLQQESFSKYGFKTKETTILAQQLYEGVETDEGLTGLITYMRTDSTRISDSFVEKAKIFIIDKYGKEFYKGQKTVKSVKLAQDAHECIRPTSIKNTPERIKKFLTDRQYKLYKLIYDRTISSLMSDKIDEITTVFFESHKNNDKIELSLKGSVNLFKGFEVVKIEDKESKEIPLFNKGETYKIVMIDKIQHFTKPPARYNEGKVVKLMEEKGIGRPSTYSSTIQTILQRKYVSSSQGNLTPTEQGTLTSTVLNKYFPDLMNTQYTAEMETLLDKIQDGEENEIDVIKNFYNQFMKHFDEVKEVMYKEPPKKTGEKCPLCGDDLVHRHGRYGDFVSCNNYPECKYIKKEEKLPPEEVGKECPVCGSKLLYRKNKKGQTFIGCSNFPKCRYVEGLEIKDENIENAPKKVCPDCGHDLILRRSKRGYFYGCTNFPKCKHIEEYKKEENE